MLRTDFKTKNKSFPRGNTRHLMIRAKTETVTNGRTDSWSDKRRRKCNRRTKIAASWDTLTDRLKDR